MKKTNLISFVALAFVAVLFSSRAVAAPITTLTGFPDVTSASMSLDYTYTGGGSGGTMTIFDSAASLHTIKLFAGDGGTLLGTLGGGAFDFFGSSYSLTANFNDAGVFTDGTISIIGWTGAGGITSGTVLTGTLDEFGFASTVSGNNADIAFNFTLTGGDLLTLGHDFGSTLIGLNGITHSTYGGGDWDATLGTDNVFQQSFSMLNGSGGSMTIDTIVPVPAAVWLFASGLIGLAGIGRRRAS